MSFYAFYPPGAAGTANASVGVNGAAIPSSSTLVAGENPSALQQPLQTDASGALITVPATGSVGHVIVDSSALPTGAATAANQATANTSLASIDTKVATAANQATANTSLASIDSKLTAPLSVTGPLTDTQLRATPVPVSTASLPLPTGAATEATLANVYTQVDGINSQINDVIVGSSSFNVRAASLPLPTGAATSAAQTTAQTSLSSIVTNTTGIATAANQTTANTSLSTIATNTGNIPTVGQKAMAASTPVVIASNQSTIAISNSGKAAVAKSYTVYSSTPVTTSAYVQIVASTSAAITHISIFDSSGQALIIATGAAASEVDQLYIPPGGGEFDLAIASGTRISIKALTASATSGYQLFNGLGV